MSKYSVVIIIFIIILFIPFIPNTTARCVYPDGYETNYLVCTTGYDNPNERGLATLHKTVKHLSPAGYLIWKVKRRLNPGQGGF